jgi:uncharacterized protein (TIGR02266 family)
VRATAARLESAATHTHMLEDERERALAAREEALEARRRATQELQQVVLSFQQCSTLARQELAEVESGLQRAAEATRSRQAAAARAQQEAAARARREAAQAAQAAAAATKASARPQAPGAPQQASLDRPNRVRLQTAIDLRSDSNFFTGFTTDISEGGIFIATVQRLPLGTQVELDFTLPGGGPLRVQGQVRWSREVSDRSPELMPGLGVQFLDLPPDVAAAISSFIANRDPLFFPD